MLLPGGRKPKQLIVLLFEKGVVVCVGDGRGK